MQDQMKNIQNINIGKIIFMINKIKSIPSFCTSNKEVLNSIMVFAKIYNLPLLIETTSNQVNQFGGYSKLTPRKFYNKIMKMTERFNLNKNRVTIGADHLGPLPWEKKMKKLQLKIQSVYSEIV